MAAAAPDLPGNGGAAAPRTPRDRDHETTSAKFVTEFGDWAVYTTPFPESWKGRGESDIGVYPRLWFCAKLGDQSAYTLLLGAKYC